MAKTMAHPPVHLEIEKTHARSSKPSFLDQALAAYVQATPLGFGEQHERDITGDANAGTHQGPCRT